MANITTSNVYRIAWISRRSIPASHSNLIEVQRKSYHRFLQMDVPPAEREDVGLQAVSTRSSDQRFSRHFLPRVRRVFDRELAVQMRKPQGFGAPAGELRRVRETDRQQPVQSRQQHVPALRCAQRRSRTPGANSAAAPWSLNVKYTVEECQSGDDLRGSLKVTVRVWLSGQG